ncbi:MAG: hypothetical protein ACTHLA_16370 [Asticcacaulis sp.]|uniref:hypothetical protein n=1 Tax=Asticcacaulis sp. TaxID=1872648 RepID=UPI003F7C5755
MQTTSINLDSHGVNSTGQCSRRRLTDAQIAEIASLRERGWATRALALRFGVTVSLVEWHCLRLGAEAPKSRYALRSVPQAPQAYLRAGRWVRLYTQEEDARLLAMAREGRPGRQIAKALQRSATSVTGRLMVLARREARAET